MKDFIAIDFETGNQKRVSACAFGYAKIYNGNLIEAQNYLIKPIGGHAQLQSNMHGIRDEHTFDKPEFGELFPKIQGIFHHTLIGHTMFDKQVLYALLNHFNLNLTLNYIDSCALAKERLPDLDNHKLPTLVKHFGLPEYKQHDAKEDAIACASIFLKLQENQIKETQPILSDKIIEFREMAIGILSDDEINYKEAYELLYWLEDNINIAEQNQKLYLKTKEVLEDDHLDCIEINEIKILLKKTLKEINN